MKRRGFLATILAAGVAPAIVRADSLMRVIARDTTIVRPKAIACGQAFVDLSRRLMDECNVDDLVKRDLAEALAREIDGVFVNAPRFRFAIPVQSDPASAAWVDDYDHSERCWARFDQRIIEIPNPKWKPSPTAK